MLAQRVSVGADLGAEGAEVARVLHVLGLHVLYEMPLLARVPALCALPVLPGGGAGYLA